MFGSYAGKSEYKLITYLRHKSIVATTVSASPATSMPAMVLEDACTYAGVSLNVVVSRPKVLYFLQLIALLGLSNRLVLLRKSYFLALLGSHFLFIDK